MKKTLLLNLLFLTAFTIFAQKKKVEYGFQGGINLNSAYGDGVATSLLSNTTGLSAGVHIKWNTSNHFGIKVLPSYDQFGWAYRSFIFESGLFTGSKSDLFYKFNYINLPIVAEYSVGKKVKWNINTGVFTGFLLKGKIIEKNSPPLALGQLAVVEYTIQDVKKFNFGVTVGTGLQVPLTSTISLNLDVRNSTGLIRTIKQGSGYSSSKTLTYSLLSGLSFQL